MEQPFPSFEEYVASSQADVPGNLNDKGETGSIVQIHSQRLPPSVGRWPITWSPEATRFVPGEIIATVSPPSSPPLPAREFSFESADICGRFRTRDSITLEAPLTFIRLDDGRAVLLSDYLRGTLPVVWAHLAAVSATGAVHVGNPMSTIRLEEMIPSVKAVFRQELDLIPISDIDYLGSYVLGMHLASRRLESKPHAMDIFFRPWNVKGKMKVLKEAGDRFSLLCDFDSRKFTMMAGSLKDVRVQGVEFVVRDAWKLQ